MTYIASIRDRRQITLPAEILRELSLSIGDKLTFQIENRKLVAKPIRTQSLDTLKTIQKEFQKAGITEKKLQKSGQEIRKKLNQKLYG